MKLYIKKYRRQRKWTKSKLADKAKVSRSYMSEVEAGKYNPTIDFMWKIARALGVTLNDLVNCNVEGE